MEWEEEPNEEEEEFQYQPHAKLDLVLQKVEKYDCETLVIAQYGPASLFTHSLIPPSPPLNRLNFSKAKQLALADLYQSSTSNTIFLVFNDPLPPMR